MKSLLDIVLSIFIITGGIIFLKYEPDILNFVNFGNKSINIGNNNLKSSLSGLKYTNKTLSGYIDSIKPLHKDLIKIDNYLSTTIKSLNYSIKILDKISDTIKEIDFYILGFGNIVSSLNNKLEMSDKSIISLNKYSQSILSKLELLEKRVSYNETILVKFDKLKLFNPTDFLNKFNKNKFLPSSETIINNSANIRDTVKDVPSKIFKNADTFMEGFGF